MKIKTIIIVFVIVALVILGLAIWQYSVTAKGDFNQSQKDEVYKKILGRDVKEEQNIVIKDYKSKYYAIKYPSNISIRENKASESAVPSSLDTLRLISFEPRLNATIMVVDATNTSLKDYSAVKFRSQSETYKVNAQVTLVAGIDAISFTNTEGNPPEQSTFFKKGNMIYSIASTGPNATEVEKLQKTLLENFTF